MIIERRMDEQLQPLMPPFEGPSNAIPDEGKTCHHCYKLPDGVQLLRAFSVDHGNASQNTRGERKVITKASSSHKFTIINYGRSSIPNSSYQPGDIGLDSIVAVTPEREDSSVGEKLNSAEAKLQDKSSHSESVRDSGIENTSEKLNEVADRIKTDQTKDKDFVLTITPSSQNVSLKLPGISPTVSPSDQNVKNSLTPFFSTVQATKCPSGQQSYWKNKTSRWNEIAKIGRIFTKRNKLRLIQQSGECNVMYSNVHRKNVRYLTDLFTTLMELKWRYNILFYLVSFVLSWIMFALLWLGLHCAYGLDENQVPCVEGVRDFKTALLFSIETQQTIGYGSRAVSDRCLFSYFLLMLQSVFGAITQCVVTGIVFSKLARPDKRAETVIFSKRAVICQSSKEPGACLNLEFRVGDIRNSQLIGVRINAVLVRKSFENNGRQVELQQKCLKITTESEDDFYFLAWPIKVIHRIDPSSPFWNTTPQDVALADFEILIVLEANCESTGGTVQVKTSYLPSEIVWGGKLSPLFTRTKFNGRYKVDYSRFDEIITDDTLYDHGDDNCQRIQVERDAGDPGLVKSSRDHHHHDHDRHHHHHMLGSVGNNFKLEQNSLASLALDDSSP